MAGMARALAGAMLLMASAAAAAAEPEMESSRELEVRYRFDARTRLHAMVSLSSDNLGSFRESAFGLALDRRLGERWSVRGGARYIGRNEEEPDAADSVEHRGILDATYSRALGDSWTLSNRNRVDLRWREGRPFSYRIRDRLMLERAFRMGGKPASWYGSAEVFHDKCCGGISRDRVIAGITLSPTAVLGVELYYSLTHDRRPSRETFGTVGFTIMLQFARPDPTGGHARPADHAGFDDSASSTARP